MAKRLSDKQKLFLVAFKKQATNIARTCKAIHIDRQTYYNWMSANSTFKRKIENLREEVLDYAESKLYANVKEGKEQSILFLLKTRGKDRGYRESAVQNNVNIESDVLEIKYVGDK